MKRTTLILFSLVILASMLVTSCASPAAPSAPQAPAAQATVAPAAPAAAPAAATAKGTKYYWIQPVKGHPVHQLTQAAFLTSCKAQGMECEVVGPDDADTNKLIAAAEQVLAKGDAAGVSFWTGSPAYLDVIKKFDAAGIPVAAPHFMVPEGTWPANTFTMGTDPSAYAANAAVAICKLVGKDKAGSVALTQGSFNTTENLVSESFTKKMATECPNLKVLKPEEEGFDPPKAIAKAVAIMQANPDLVAALSTTGGGPTTWAGAQKETGKKIPAIGMDYTKVNLDLVKNGEMYAVVGQPLWDESFLAAQMLKKAAAGEKQPYWTPMEAPIITAADVDKYYKMLADAEAMFKAPAAAAAPKGTKYYWIQPVKGHPVHQLTQAAFLTSCKAQGMECEVVGPDDADTNKLIAAAEQVLAKGDAAGVSFWTGSPAYLDVIKKFDAAGIPVAAPHFMVPEGTWPANTFTMGTDPSAYAANAAVEICKLVGKDKAGSVALTQGSFNTTENLVSESFTAKMATECPNLKVLKPEEEGFDPPKAIAKAVAIMQANPDIVAALSTTGGGPTTWAGAQKETGKKIPAIGMDYTKVNLDLVKNGEMYAVVGQPLWDESFLAAQMLKKAAAGEKQPYWTPMEAPIITAADVDKYYKMLADAEAMFKAPAAAAAPKGTKYYWIQPVKGHPVHQLTQAAFLTSCKAQGMECEVVGPDDADTNKLIAAAEQVLAKGDAAGVSFWTGSPAYLDVIKKFDAAGIPVAAPHFMVPEGTWPANTFTMGTDPSAYAANAAVEICKLVGKDKAGSVALTQGSFNTTENLVSESFTKKMADRVPQPEGAEAGGGRFRSAEGHCQGCGDHAGKPGHRSGAVDDGRRPHDMGRCAEGNRQEDPRDRHGLHQGEPGPGEERRDVRRGRAAAVG